MYTYYTSLVPTFKISNFLLLVSFSFNIIMAGEPAQAEEWHLTGTVT